MPVPLALLLACSAGWTLAAPPARPLRFDKRPPAALAKEAGKLLAHGRYLRAEPLLQRRLDLVEALEGKAGLATLAAARSDLADLYALEGRYGQAEELYDDAWDVLRPAFGLEHPSVLRLADHMAELYRLEGRWLRSEDLQRRTLDARERRFGPDHPEVAESVDDLGRLLRDEGRFVDAESLLRRALAIRERTFGKRSVPVALTLSHLGRLYREQDRWEESETVYREALGLQRRALGARHPDTAATMTELAAVLRRTGEPLEADQLEAAAQDARARLAQDLPPHETYD